ncbi:hypothetical protein [Cellulosimicrobium protaetiae]
MLRIDVLRALPDPTILDEPEFDVLRARLDEIDAREAAFAAREADRHRAHDLTAHRWHDAARAAALTGDEPPAGSAPEFTPTPGADAFAVARQTLAREIRDTWQRHRAAIVARGRDAARRAHDLRLAAHADAAAAERAARDDLDRAATEVRRWDRLQRPEQPARPERVGHPDDVVADTAAAVLGHRDPWQPPPVAIRPDHGSGISLPGR